MTPEQINELLSESDGVFKTRFKKKEQQMRIILYSVMLTLLLESLITSGLSWINPLTL